MRAVVFFKAFKVRNNLGRLFLNLLWWVILLDLRNLIQHSLVNFLRILCSFLNRDSSSRFKTKFRTDFNLPLHLFTLYGGLSDHFKVIAWESKALNEYLELDCLLAEGILDHAYFEFTQQLIENISTKAKVWKTVNLWILEFKRELFKVSTWIFADLTVNG